MAMPEIDEVKDLALKYDKPTLGRLAQMGQISPTLAVMAGMMRDRVVQSEMKPPTQTVAEEVMEPMGQRMGLAAAAQMPQQPQQPQPRGQGLDQVPVPPEMFDEQRMAGGGIVAFQAGGGARRGLDPRIPALQQRYPGMTVPQAIRFLATRAGPVGALSFSAGLASNLMSTDKGVGQDAAMGSGYDYGAEVMAGGQPDIPVESVGTREQGPGFTDYLRTIGLAPKEQVMDPATGKFVDVPPKPIFESATPGLAGVKDQTDVEKRLAEAEAGRGPDVERNSERAEVAEARRQDLLKQAAAEETKKAERPKVQAGPTKEAAKEKEGKKTFNDYLTEVTSEMGTSTVGQDMRDEIDKDRKARKEDQQNAMWMSLVEAGLGIMGGESPYAFVNIGKGATNALKSYADRLREQKKLDREDRKILLDLEKAERAELRDNYRLASESYNKALDRMNATDRANISARASMYAADKSLEAAGMLKPGPAITSRLKLAEAVDAQLVMDRQYQKLKQGNPAAAEAFRKQIIDARANELGLNQMPGLNLGAWGQLTTVPGAR